MKPIPRTPKVSPTGGDLAGAYNTLPYHLVEQTLAHPEHNYFITFLYEMFTEDTVKRLIADYRIGTSKRWYGATVFWQIDVKDEVRTGKIMLYDVETCKRVKYPYNHIAWAHKLLDRKSGSPEVGKIMSQKSPQVGKSGSDHKETINPPPNSLSDFPTQKEFNLKQCLFGEHLLTEYPEHTVALVESEKTAIIAAGYLPEYLWLAAGSLEGLTLDKCRVLNGRNVMLFPDLGATAKWQEKANKLNAKLPAANFTVSQYLQSNALPGFRYPGMDLGDFFLMII